MIFPVRGTVAAALAALAVALGVAAAPAAASEKIDSFTTSTSTTQAGGHPDLTTSFTLENPGAPEAAQNVIFNAPGGLFGDPYATIHCTSSDFALDQCPSDSQAGLITVRYDNSGLLGTAPIFDLETPGEPTALFAFIVPTLNIPIQIPVAVRTGGDYGLRFTVSNITQVTPLAGASLTFWGFPAAASHAAERFPKGVPGEPANCAGLTDTSCIKGLTPASEPVHPFTDNPTTCTGEPLTATLEVQTYQDPEHLSAKTLRIPGDDRMQPGGLQTRPLRQPDDRRNRLPLGSQHRAERPSVPRPRRLAFGAQIGKCHPARRIHHQPRRRRRADRLHGRPG